jgi:hypothetical protein
MHPIGWPAPKLWTGCHGYAHAPLGSFNRERSAAFRSPDRSISIDQGSMKVCEWLDALGASSLRANRIRSSALGIASAIKQQGCKRFLRHGPPTTPPPRRRRRPGAQLAARGLVPPVLANHAACHRRSAAGPALDELRRSSIRTAARGHQCGHARNLPKLPKSA